MKETGWAGYRESTIGIMLQEDPINLIFANATESGSYWIINVASVTNATRILIGASKLALGDTMSKSGNYSLRCLVR